MLDIKVRNTCNSLVPLNQPVLVRADVCFLPVKGHESGNDKLGLKKPNQEASMAAWIIVFKSTVSFCSTMENTSENDSAAFFKVLKISKVVSINSSCCDKFRP